MPNSSKTLIRLSEFQNMWDIRSASSNMTGRHMKRTTPDARRFLSALYRSGPSEHELEKMEIDKKFLMEDEERSQSECTCPVLNTPKKNGSLRFCFYYRNLIAVPVKYAYFIPGMSDCLHFFGETPISSKLNASSACWQM